MPPKPDAEEDPVGLLEWELRYMPSAFGPFGAKKFTEAEIQAHLQRFREGLESGKYKPLRREW